MFVNYMLVVVFCLHHFQATAAGTVKRIVIVYRGTNGGQDAVKNNACKAYFCKDGLSCLSGDCCQCTCPSDRPNYFVSQRRCLSNDDIQYESNANCEYSLGAPQSPIATLTLTNTVNGSHEFHKDHSNPPGNLAICNHTLTTGQWKYLDAHGKWRIGDDDDIFNVQYKPVGVGPQKDQYLLTSLQWHGKLSAQYAGVIIKISLTCDSRQVGCVLVKSDGTRTYDTDNVQTTAPQVPTTASPVPTTQNIDIQPTNNITGNNDRQKQDGNKGKTSGRSTGNAALAPALGVVGALLLVAALCVAVMLYRRRQRRKSDAKPWIHPDVASVANLEDFAEPIYAEVNKDGDDFDNPLYCDPSLDENKRPRSALLGPLPTIPGTETAYQALDSLTRKSQGEDVKDYENPIDGVSPSEDYDNPPVGVGAANGKEASDYDNPPADGTSEKTAGDYDNPPSLEGGDNSPEKFDYDVPKSDDGDGEDTSL